MVESIKAYSRADFRSDLVAGVTVGIVALPLDMAFGIASGAFIAILYDIYQQYGAANAGLLDAVGRDNVCADTESAFTRAKERPKK